MPQVANPPEIDDTGRIIGDGSDSPWESQASINLWPATVSFRRDTGSTKPWKTLALKSLVPLGKFA
ncbi:MAG TPA: hypothetical protein DDY91_18725 [Planctomycetaceae bacterium]|nr:hypothetical protein [Planctomycetaceae bacterium]